MIKTKENIYEAVLISENSAHIVGTVKETLEDRSFWIETKRLSGTVDTIKCQPITNIDDIKIGDRIEVFGKLRSVRTPKGIMRDKLSLYIEASVLNSVDEKTKDVNEVTICGYLNKDGLVRKTPLGRDIMNFFVSTQVSVSENGMLVVDAIPCICWGGNALRGHRLAKRNVMVKVTGRLQERHYQKQLSSGDIVDKMIHELSASSVFYDEE